MQPNNQTAYTSKNSEAPDDIAYTMYAMLTEENKEKVNRFVESLKAEQYTLSL